jgi:TrmH family RNA methyltransferase
MTEPEITSRANQHVQHARAVRDGKHPEMVFVEGLRLAEDVQSSGAMLTEAFVTQEFLEENPRGENLVRSARESGTEIHLVSPGVLESLADTRSPAGIVMLVQRPTTGREVLEEKMAGVPLIVLAHRINNPANAGAILRTAEAAGATGAILTQQSADVFSPKGLRGAMGSSFRLPLWTGASFEEAIGWCKAQGIRTVGAALDAKQDHVEFDWTWRTTLVVGSEGQGLTPGETGGLDELITIPMRPPVESLNVAAAAAILLYEANRQRKP